MSTPTTNSGDFYFLWLRGAFVAYPRRVYFC